MTGLEALELAKELVDDVFKHVDDPDAVTAAWKLLEQHARERAGIDRSLSGRVQAPVVVPRTPAPPPGKSGTTLARVEQVKRARDDTR